MLKPYLRFIFCFILIIAIDKKNAFAQHYISKYEYCWAVFHPKAAFKIKKQLPKAMEVYYSIKQKKVLDTLENGGKLDAFRHTYTMAFLSKYVKVRKLKKLGVAHEKGNKLQFHKQTLEFGERPDSLAGVMDLLNNDLGFKIGVEFKSKTNNELLNEVISQIQQGNAYYLKRNHQNSYLTCSNAVINLKFYIDKWAIPKCLIRTNE